MSERRSMVEARICPLQQLELGNSTVATMYLWQCVQQCYFDSCQPSSCRGPLKLKLRKGHNIDMGYPINGYEVQLKFYGSGGCISYRKENSVWDRPKKAYRSRDGECKSTCLFNNSKRLLHWRQSSRADRSYYAKEFWKLFLSAMPVGHRDDFISDTATTISIPSIGLFLIITYSIDFMT
ncbi:unnamed protein product [Owenia fusiformis]|uniref:Uncharacterized protein n=1 Tax=Owenia fusiformis TaxID=6347 RepID=A0A8S4PD52_OWEFU|nr:unnamed protein product [Owenia fusiformis]